MNKKFSIKIIRAGALSLLALTLAGCSVFTPAPTPVPTMDPVVIADMAVKTMEAKITQAAIDNPSPTPLPSATPLPTATPLPPATATPAASPMPAGPTTTVAVQGTAAKFVYATTYNGVETGRFTFVPNEYFGVAIGFQNVGTTTWSPGYSVKLTSFTGEDTVRDEASTSNAVAPGGKVEFDLDAFGSETLGQHTFVFQLYSDSGMAVPGGVAYFTYTSE